MMTTLTVDSETQRLVQAIAEAAGKPVATVVREALAAHASRYGVVPPIPRTREKSPAEIGAAIDEIVEHVRTLPVLDPRAPDEIIGYNEFGLPAIPPPLPPSAFR